MNFRVAATSCVFVSSLFVCATPASAHLDLTTPPPRLGGQAGGTQLKTGPCGQRDNARTSTVTVYQPGETITVAWDEYVNHPSYYRVAFDVDGDDDFPIRADMDSVVRAGDDPAAVNPIGDVVLAYVAEDPDMASYSVEVTLPSMECENCTLQVIQFMYDKLGDGRDNEYYFQCADIALRGDAPPPTDGGTPPGSDAGDPPPETDSGTMMMMGTDSGSTPPPPGGDDDGGCAVVSPGHSESTAGLLGALAVFGLFVGRRRRAR